jgi:hypothetical protein
LGRRYSDAGAERNLEVPRQFPGHCRRNSHPALQRDGSDSKARAVWIPGPFTSADDLKKVLAWEKRLAEEGTFLEKPELALKKPIDQEAIVARLPNDLGRPLTTTELRSLPVVPAQFRDDHPKEWCRRFRWANPNRKRGDAPAKEVAADGAPAKRTGNRHKGRCPRLWYAKRVYVYAAFKRWLCGRDIVELSKEHRR